MVETELLTTQEAADILRIPRRQLWVLLREGVIPSVNMGHRTKRVLRVDIDAYIASKGVNT